MTNIEEVKKMFPGDWEAENDDFILSNRPYFIWWGTDDVLPIFVYGIERGAQEYDASLDNVQCFYNKHFKFKNFI